MVNTANWVIIYQPHGFDGSLQHTLQNPSKYPKIPKSEKISFDQVEIRFLDIFKGVVVFSFYIECLTLMVMG